MRNADLGWGGCRARVLTVSSTAGCSMEVQSQSCHSFWFFFFFKERLEIRYFLSGPNCRLIDMVSKPPVGQGHVSQLEHVGDLPFWALCARPSVSGHVHLMSSQYILKAQRKAVGPHERYGQNKQCRLLWFQMIHASGWGRGGGRSCTNTGQGGRNEWNRGSLPRSRPLWVLFWLRLCFLSHKHGNCRMGKTLSRFSKLSVARWREKCYSPFPAGVLEM